VKLADILIMLLIALFLFGGSKIPRLGAGLGNALRNLEKGLDGRDEQRAPSDGTGKRVDK